MTMMDGAQLLVGECLVAGKATGKVLYSDVPLSFMGGVDPSTGVVIDRHHPLTGVDLTGRVLAMPSGRGSCSGSGTILEMVLNGTAPAALIFSHKESILTLGVVIADEMFDCRIPVVRLSNEDFGHLRTVETVSVHDGEVSSVYRLGDAIDASTPATPCPLPDITLSATDRQFLDGDLGEAGKVAMRVLLRAAHLHDATELIDVDMAHIDGAFYQGPASLRFAVTLRDMGAKVRIPSSMNSLLVDRRQWRRQGVPRDIGEPSDQLAAAYEDMGVQPTYTCAPYLLAKRPAFGQQIAWAESNAVVFANSVIGARTMKYPDYLDLIIAITGRAPKADCHLDAARRPTVVIELAPLLEVDDCLFPTLGYHVGNMVPYDVPVVTGLERYEVSLDDLKAFGAAFATTSASPMFHIVGATPEAETFEQATNGCGPLRRLFVNAGDLARTWGELNTATSLDVDLVSLGNPHFSLTEIEQLAELLERHGHPVAVPLIVTCGREIAARARVEGYVERIERLGGSILNDTCWCLINEPIVPPAARTVMTNSGKYAHYGAAAINRGIHLRSLPDCVEAACTGRTTSEPPRWCR